LVNTSVIRAGKDYDANVTAALWDFTIKNKWNLNGKFAVSNLMGYEAPGKNYTGYTYNIGFGKTSGRFNFNFWQELQNNQFRPDDMGYFTNNNYLIIIYGWDINGCSRRNGITD